MNRRKFTRSAAVAGIAPFTMPLFAGTGNKGSAPFPVVTNKLSLNAYSFNNPLRAGTMTIFDMLDYCARTGFDGVDLTGYYFPGYPAVPSDDYIFAVKKKAFNLGLYINGTGVKNDFTWSDPSKRAEEKKLVKEWIIVAEKLGAPSLRIFAGDLSKEKFSWDEKAKWISDDIRECAEEGKKHGVMLALQNHNDFIKTAPEVEKLLKMIGSEWVGLMLDIGSYRVPDTYAQIEANSKFVISWQLKEKIYINNNQVDTDYEKVMGIVKRCGYKGYLPLETLGEGDPGLKIEALLSKVKKAMTAV